MFNGRGMLRAWNRSQTLALGIVLTMILAANGAHATATTLGSLPSSECELASGTSCVDTAGAISSTAQYANMSSSQTCQDKASGQPVVGCYDGARSIAGQKALMPIDVWGTCRYIDNTAKDSLFVPFRSSGEWSAFLNAATKLSLTSTPCARPYSSSVPAITSLPAAPSVACTLPSNTPLVVPNIYQRSGKRSPQPTQSIALSCNGGGTSLPTQEYWTAGTSADIPNFSGGSFPPSADWALTVNYAPYVGLSATKGTLQTQPVSGTSSVSLDPGSSFDLTWTTAPSGSNPVTTHTPANSTSSPPTPDQTLTQNIATSLTASWTNNLATFSGSTTMTAPLTGSTTYKITATDKNGWTSVATLTVYADPLAVCGAANGQTVAQAPSLPADLCGGGSTASSMTKTGTGWAWICSAGAGTSKPTTATCAATQGSIVATCGSDNNQLLVAKPTHLCSEGTASSVTESNGAYTWSCTGAQTTASCRAGVSISPSSCPNPTVITTSTALPSMSGGSYAIQGNGLTVTVDDPSYSCFAITGDNNTFTVSDANSANFRQVLDNTIKVTGNSNNLNIDGANQIISIQGDRNVVDFIGHSDNCGFLYSGICWKGTGQHYVTAIGDYTTIMNENSLFQTNLTVIGNNATITNRGNVYITHAFLTGNNSTFTMTPGINTTEGSVLNRLIEMDPNVYATWTDDWHVQGDNNTISVGGPSSLSYGQGNAYGHGASWGMFGMIVGSNNLINWNGVNYNNQNISVCQDHVTVNGNTDSAGPYFAGSCP